MIIKCTPEELSTITPPFKVIAQDRATYECVVEVKVLPEGHIEIQEVPEGFEQRCLPPSYGRFLNKSQIDEGRRQEKVKEISKWLEDDLKSGVVTSVISPIDGNPIKMNAEYEDVTKLDGAVRLSQKLGVITVDVGDYNNETQTAISIEDADQISIEMAVNYSTKLSKKWNLRNQALTITIEDLDTLTW